MKRSILVTGGDTFLGALLVRRFSDSGHQVVTTHQATHDKKRGTKETSTCTWMRGSSISAKNVLMEARQALPELDTVYIVVSPLNIQTSFDETAPVAMELQWDDWIKGTTFLAREVMKENRGQGMSLSFIFYLEETAEVNPVTALVYEGMAAFAKALMKQRTGSRIAISAYECRNGDGPNFVEYISTQEESLHGQWKTFPEKSSLFGKIQRRSIA